MNAGGPDETTIEGEVERVTFEAEDSGFRVVKVNVPGRGEPLTVVGIFPPLATGSRVRVRGTLVKDARYGEQLKALHVTELLPNTLVGVERYLGSGLIKGIGEGYAKRIVSTFGLDTLRVLDEQPDRLREVEGLGKKRSESIAHAWKDQRAVREVMVFLQAHGASGALATRIYRRYGNDAIAVVSRDPYRLALDVWGIGFKTADRIASELGIGKDDPARLQAGVLQTVHDVNDNGHVCFPEEALITRALGLLEIEDRAAVTHALRALHAGRYVVVEEPPHGEPLVFAQTMHAAEVRLAGRVAELAASAPRALGGAEAAIAEFEKRSNVELAPAQKEAVTQAAMRQVLVITGGPGVGKTTIVRAILSAFDRARLTTKLAAPTGRAAKRLAESTGREATTLHRLLDFDPKRGTFRRDGDNPIEADALVVDEASMIDLAMADALTQALAVGTRLVLVGDVDQLPSVGPGAVLRDLLASQHVPAVRLTHVFRQAQASLIVQSAHRIHDGLPPVASKDPKSDFFMIERRDAEAAKATILELVTSRIPKAFGLDPVKDVQVLTPMHRGPAGSIALNEALQAALNPTGPTLTRGSRTFRLGDKVMQLKNDYDRDVFNGDLGVVSRLSAEEMELHVRYDDEREVAYDAGSLEELTLAYACSIHKSQGSEYPAVVVPMLTTHFVMLSRNLLYTAVTRGKRLVVLVYDPRALSVALAEDRRNERFTQLEARLRADGPRDHSH
ncbi:MAG: recD [Myxococcaceae bacterium]|nr:recD [Myxococcaceae bacterium]